MANFVMASSRNNRSRLDSGRSGGRGAAPPALVAVTRHHARKAAAERIAGGSIHSCVRSTRPARKALAVGQ